MACQLPGMCAIPIVLIIWHGTQFHCSSMSDLRSWGHQENNETETRNVIRPAKNPNSEVGYHYWQSFKTTWHKFQEGHKPWLDFWRKFLLYVRQAYAVQSVRQHYLYRLFHIDKISSSRMCCATLRNWWFHLHRSGCRSFRPSPLCDFTVLSNNSCAQAVDFVRVPRLRIGFAFVCELLIAFLHASGRPRPGIKTTQ